MFYLVILIVIAYHFYRIFTRAGDRMLNSPDIHFPWQERRFPDSRMTFEITLEKDNGSAGSKILNKAAHHGRAVHNGKELEING